MDTLPDWALTEPVIVTLVLELNEARVYLFSRINIMPLASETAFTVTLPSREVTSGDRVLLNGTDMELGDNLMPLLSIIDEVVCDERYELGVSLISRPHPW